jgi:hypothetical protein
MVSAFGQECRTLYQTKEIDIYDDDDDDDDDA